MLPIRTWGKVQSGPGILVKAAKGCKCRLSTTQKRFCYRYLNAMAIPECDGDT